MDGHPLLHVAALASSSAGNSATPYTRAISLAVLFTSLAITWLGINLTHG